MVTVLIKVSTTPAQQMNAPLLGAAILGTGEQGPTRDQQLCPAGVDVVEIPAGTDVDPSIRGVHTGEVELGA